MARQKGRKLSSMPCLHKGSLCLVLLALYMSYSFFFSEMKNGLMSNVFSNGVVPSIKLVLMTRSEQVNLNSDFNFHETEIEECMAEARELVYIFKLFFIFPKAYILKGPYISKEQEDKEKQFL